MGKLVLTVFYIVLTVLVSACSNTGKAVSESVISAKTYPLYEGDIPHAIAGGKETIRPGSQADIFIKGVVVPEISVYKATNNTRKRAVIICPGGGYTGLSMVKEGHQVAQRFAKNGVTAIVLKYRMPQAAYMQDKRLAPLQDVQQAIAWVKQRKVELGVEEVGVMGFSAGGHLAASAAVHFDSPVLQHLSPSEVKPDFQILVYPVISMREGITHAGSRNRLIGPHLYAQDIAYFSNEQQVDSAVPPAFIVHSGDDKAVPVENSLIYYQALKDNQVKAQLLILPQGGHGYGMRHEFDWFADLVTWMELSLPQ